MDKDDQPLQLPKDFFKQFKNKEEFQSFFNTLFKQGVEEMLKGELDQHLGYEKYSKEGHNTGYDDRAAQKAVYLVLINIEKKWNMPLHNWGLVLHQFVTIFENRCRL